LDEMPGVPLQDLWLDISPLQSRSVERFGCWNAEAAEASGKNYQTCVKRKFNRCQIYFGGSGTDRRRRGKINSVGVITSDLGKPAAMILLRKRLQ